MPEGDTIARAAAVLHQALAGQVVNGFVSELAPVAAVHDDHPVTGRTVERAVAHGKHLVLAFSGGLLLRTHMRMHGSWHLYRPGERWQRAPRHMRLCLDTAPWIAVAFDVYDAELVPGHDPARRAAVSLLGPDLLSPALDVAAVATRLGAEGARAIGDVLLDQRVAAGIGNVFRSELLFLAGVHPRTPAGALSVERCAALVQRAVVLLRANARVGAGRRVTTGRLAPGEALWVYQRTTAPCRRCGTPIESAAEAPLTRRVYWCPRCQPAPAVPPG
jgi:endonuclease-8